MSLSINDFKVYMPAKNFDLSKFLAGIYTLKSLILRDIVTPPGSLNHDLQLTSKFQKNKSRCYAGSVGPLYTFEDATPPIADVSGGELSWCLCRTRLPPTLFPL